MKNSCKYIKLGDICEKITKGTTPSTYGYPFISSGVNYIKAESITKEGRINPSSFVYISEEAHQKLKRSQIKLNDVLFTMAGIFLGKVAILKDKSMLPANTNQAVAIIRISYRCANPFYVYYFLQQDSITRYVNSSTGQSAQPNINLNEISNLRIRLPSIDIQNCIVNILRSLDDKIELNNKINRNLEAQAQAIFKSWFIDFEPFKNGKFIDSELGKIPEGWKVGKLSDIANITMGQSPNGNSYNEKKIGMIFFQGRAEFGWRFPRNRLYTTAPKRIAERDSVLLSIRAPVGDINKTLERCCIGRGLASLTSNHKTFLYYKMQSIRHLLDVYNGEGTVFGSINKNTLQEIRTIIPIDSEIIRFELKLKVVDELIRNNYIENLRLIKLRDTLLPELMSGKIDILRFSNR